MFRQLLLDRHVNGESLLIKGNSTMSFTTSSGEVSATPKRPSKIFAPPQDIQDLEEDPMVEVIF